MKFVFCFATLLTVIAHLGICQPLQWSAPVEVPSGGNYGSTRPRITLCNGVPVIVWSNESTKSIFSSRLVSGVFSMPQNVTPMGFEAFAADWTGPEIDSRGDTLFVSFTDNNTPPGPAYVVRSTDGGITFDDTVRVPLMGNEVPRFASVEVMAGGNPMVTMMRFDSSFADPMNVVSYSNDGGLTFQPYTVATSVIPGEPCDCCPVSIVANENVSAVLYRNNDANIRDTWAALSYDGASTFTEAARLDSNEWMIMSCPSSGPDGYIFGDTLVSVFMNGGGPNGNKVYVASTDYNTAQVQPQRQIFQTPTSTNQNFPRIDGTGDTLGVVWKQQVGMHSEVMVAHSFAGPTGLGLYVDTLTAGTTGSQVYPDIAAGGGKLHVVFENLPTGKVYYMNAELPTSPNVVSALNSNYGFSVIQNNMDEIQLRSTKAFTTRCAVRLMDVTGHVVYLNEAGDLFSTGSLSVNTRQLLSGIYFVVINTDLSFYTAKVYIAR